MRSEGKQGQGSKEKFRALGGVLILTSAASEGIDLGFVKHAVHYDIPRSPANLFQRFGRLERFNATPGPTHNYFLIDEMNPLSRMLSKILQFKDFGSDIRL